MRKRDSDGRTVTGSGGEQGRGGGAGRASIASVAKRAGVSIATVSRVVNGVPNKASEETVARVQRAIRELGYRPTSAGQALRSRQSRLVAVLAANLANPTMAAIAGSAEAALRQAGLVMVLCDTHDRPDLQDEYLLEMRAHQVRAIVLLGAVESPGLRASLADGETLLFVGRRCPTPEAGLTAFVGVDNASAAREVADHLVAKGCRRPAVIHGSLASSATAARVAAFLERLGEHRIRLGPESVVGGPSLDHLMLGHAGMGALLDRAGDPPDAVFCLSDLIAFGAHRQAVERGIAVPGGMRIVGFDDNPLNPWVAPWLSSVRVPYSTFGPAILAALERLWDGEEPPSRILEHALVVR